MTDEEREEIENNPVMTGEDELGGRIEQGMTNEEAAQLTGWDANGGDEYGDAQTDLLEDRNAIKKEQDKQFIEGGAKRTGDPLATSTGDLEGSYRQSIADASKGGTVVGTGTRLADDRSWEARYNDMMARRKAERAGLKAQSLARQELLDTGKYFDDGRGNIKLKKSEREFRRPDSTRRGWHVDTTADNGAGMRYIQKAGQDAYSGSMGGWQQALDAQNAEKASASKKKMSDFISLNRQSLKEIETARKEKDVNSAKAKFSLFGGIAAAYDALKNELANTDESSFTPEKAWALGKDAKGNVTTGDMQNTGKYMKRGFVTGKALQSLNQEIKSYGGDYQVVGLMAQQKFNDVKGSAYGKPMIIARIKRFDEATGKPVYSDEVFSLDRAYQMGMDFGKAGDVNDYKNLVWDGIGDIHGERKRAIEAATAKDRAKLAIEQEKQKGLAARNDANIAAKERMNEADNKTRLDIAAIRERTLERKKTSDPKFDEKHYNALAARLDSLTKDADGNDRDPATMTDADRKKAEAIQTAMDDMLFGKVNTGGAGGRQGAESAAGGANAAHVQSKDNPIPSPNGKDTDIHNGKEYKWGFNDERQRWEWIFQRNVETQPQTAQGQQAQAQGGVKGQKFSFEQGISEKGNKYKLVRDENGDIFGVILPSGVRKLWNEDNEEYVEIPEGTLAPWEKSDAKTDGAKAQGQPQQNAKNVGKQSGAAIVEQFGKKGEQKNGSSHKVDSESKTQKPVSAPREISKRARERNERELSKKRIRDMNATVERKNEIATKLNSSILDMELAELEDEFDEKKRSASKK